MIASISDELGMLKGTVTQQYRGWKPLEPQVAEALSRHTGISVEELLRASLEDIEQVNIPIPEYVGNILKDFTNCAVSNELVESYENLNEFVKAVELETGYQVLVKKLKINKITNAPVSEHMFHHGEYEIHYIIEKKERK